jgi:UDP-N-acetylmuramoyl-L-alanyl-D-glutamate--2,6-diaminopimelate ligase
MTEKRSLFALLESVPGVIKTPDDDICISGITFDSRRVVSGDIFVAIKGSDFDAHQFIAQAIVNGAVAILGTENLLNLKVPYVQVENSRKALSYLASAYYDHPSHKMVVIGVTGTDGKTTTVSLIESILQAAGYKVGMISTVNALIAGEQIDTGFHVTTPDALTIQKYLSQMQKAGLTHVVLEVTSHGLAQYRVAAIEFDVAVLTNITHEHLDYHGSFQAYRESKALLFQSLTFKPIKKASLNRFAVLNRDDGSYDYLASLITVPYISYGLSTDAEVQAVDVRYVENGMKFIVNYRKRNEQEIELKGFRVPIKCNLVGKYNVMNCLAAIATTSMMGIGGQAIGEGIAGLRGIPGRMERIEMGQDFMVIVDFAHTPNALRNALLSARTIMKENKSPGRVIAVLGSAGLRDKKKRRMMAEISAELADITVITAEDPRTESLDSILSEMGGGLRDRGLVEDEDYYCIRDRGNAIRTAIDLAKMGDMVIVCGKGHEQSMCFGNIEYPWDDRIAVRASLAEYLGIDGPEMPYLPTQEEK